MPSKPNSKTQKKQIHRESKHKLKQVMREITRSKPIAKRTRIQILIRTSINTKHENHKQCKQKIHQRRQ